MAEPFSKRFRKFLGAARFVRPSLLYGQIGHDRKNMAIMQDLTVTLEKIAKMQDRIIGNVADIFSATLPKSELHFAFLVFKDAFCTFEPLQQCGVQNAIHVKRVRASA